MKLFDFAQSTDVEPWCGTKQPAKWYFIYTSSLLHIQIVHKHQQNNSNSGILRFKIPSNPITQCLSLLVGRRQFVFKTLA